MLLSVENLTVSLGETPVLRGVSFTLSTCFVGLLGRNGAGKTTLLRAILSLCPHQSGDISLSFTSDGKARSVSAMKPKERARYLSYAPQDTPAPSCSAADFVASGRMPMMGFFSAPSKRDYELAKEAAEEVGAGAFFGRNMAELSGGERKLLYLARAKVQGAAWMLLDEPAASLDYGNQRACFDALRQYAHHGAGVIATVHDPILAAEYCDRILILRDGKIAADLSPSSPDYPREIEKLYGICPRGLPR